MCGVDDATVQRKIVEIIHFQSFGFLSEYKTDTKKIGNTAYPIQRYQ
jgi:hypothetical protein